MKEISVKSFTLSPAAAFGNDWMALTAGTSENANAMTIAWGQLGALWERESHQNRLPVATCYVRPSRYTKTLMDKEAFFTLSILPPEKKKALGYLGSHSGRDGSKWEKAGLTLICAENFCYPKEAKLVLVCRKLYHAPLVESGFVDRELIDFNYPERDFHEMYIGEIVKILVNEL